MRVPVHARTIASGTTMPPTISTPRIAVINATAKGFFSQDGMWAHVFGKIALIAPPLSPSSPMRYEST